MKPAPRIYLIAVAVLFFIFIFLLGIACGIRSKQMEMHTAAGSMSVHEPYTVSDRYPSGWRFFI